jgi:hypothetical protein
MPEAAAEDVALHTPGEEAESNAARDTVQSLEAAAANDKDATIAALEQENAGLRNLVQALQDKLDMAAEGGASTEAPAPEPRLIGENWGSMTAAEAKARGCKKTVLCADGYYVPGA